MDGIGAKSGKASAAEAPVKRDSPARKHEDKETKKSVHTNTFLLFNTLFFYFFFYFARRVTRSFNSRICASNFISLDCSVRVIDMAVSTDIFAPTNKYFSYTFLSWCTVRSCLN